ncbi:MAG: tetraacyldisaccharide 4'-kinase [Halobacteriovoraceae bacterium]|nr:tetraacyldisaccharide 4'-kinase [Halobacteriovoraceae bacterium]
MSSFIYTLKLIFLSPLAFLWENVYRFRRFAYQLGVLSSSEFKVPIISVGNISFGGTGKTPFTMWLAKYFNELDLKTMILMRGYKGKLEHGSGLLKSGKKLGYNPVDFGDEAILFAKTLDNASIVVGKNRTENLRYYFPKERPDIVILDDGHQHLKLKRKLNFVLFDAMMPLAQYKVAPLGLLREGVSALEDADVIVLGRTDQVETKQVDELKDFIQKNTLKKLDFAEISYRPSGVYSLNYKLKYLPDQLKDKRFICAAAIASPNSFFNLVESLGAVIVEKLIYPDHHYFNQKDVEELLTLAIENDVEILTTEKDLVKLKKVTHDKRINFLSVSVEFLNGEEIVKKKIHEILTTI